MFNLEISLKYEIETRQIGSHLNRVAPRGCKKNSGAPNILSELHNRYINVIRMIDS